MDRDEVRSAEEISNVRLDDSELLEEILPDIRDLVARGAFTLGPELDRFEAAAAQAFGTRWCVGTSSGTSALVLALRASPLDARSRVAVPANTFFATVEAVLAAGHLPVLVDHGVDHLLDVDKLEHVDVDAVIPVHLHGLPVDMSRLNALAASRAWWVLEDAAQAHGASVGGQPVGSLGDAAAFSAYPTKNLGAWGDAGFVTGSSNLLEQKIRALRHHGQTSPNEHTFVGGTDRLDNLQALVLTAKLARLEEQVRTRRAIAAWYADGLRGLPLLLPGDRGDRVHVYHHYVIAVPADLRPKCLEVLKRNGITGAVHYPTPLHLQPALVDRVELGNDLSSANRSGAEVLSLPMHPYLSASDVDRICTALRCAVEPYFAGGVS